MGWQVEHFGRHGERFSNPSALRSQIMENNQQIERIDTLFERIAELIEQSRQYVAKAVNTAMVATYFGIGRYIVEDEQDGNYRAAYGRGVLKELSKRLNDRFGKGWSVETLTKCRKFYHVYVISETQTKFAAGRKSSPVETKSEFVSGGDDFQKRFVLPWTQYLILMRIDNPEERRFYEIEAVKQSWSKRQLQRQVASSLYERLALSRNKDEVMRLAQEGQVVEKSEDIIKNPLTLEFLGLKPDASYSETKLESAIIDKMQDFLLEMGKGFLFESRQKRFTFDEDNFYVDLVFYNRILQCYVLIDLKVKKLTHQDLGQMQMYVNYFDRYVRQEWEKPTIGILLCKSKSDALVELTLPKDANIYAQQYALCLPDKQLLQHKLQEWLDEFED